jgi:hypothetical protein
MVAINRSPKVRPTNGRLEISADAAGPWCWTVLRRPHQSARGGRQGLKICGGFDDRNRGAVWPRRCRLLKPGGPELTQDYDEGRNGRLAGQEKAAGVDLAHVPGFGAQQFGSLLSSGRTAWDLSCPMPHRLAWRTDVSCHHHLVRATTRLAAASTVSVPCQGLPPPRLLSSMGSRQRWSASTIAAISP